MNRIVLNGENRKFAKAKVGTLSALLNELGVEAATVVAEVDGMIIEREKFSSTEIKNGQNIELVRFVPGG